MKKARTKPAPKAKAKRSPRKTLDERARELAEEILARRQTEPAAVQTAAQPVETISSMLMSIFDELESLESHINSIANNHYHLGVNGDGLPEPGAKSGEASSSPYFVKDKVSAILSSLSQKTSRLEKMAAELNKII